MQHKSNLCGGLRRLNFSIVNSLISLCGGSLRRFVRWSVAVRLSRYYWLCGSAAVVAGVCPPYPPTPPRAFRLSALAYSRATLVGGIGQSKPSTTSERRGSAVAGECLAARVRVLWRLSPSRRVLGMEVGCMREAFRRGFGETRAETFDVRISAVTWLRKCPDNSVL